MDAVLVDGVVEVGAACSDHDQAASALASQLAGARAPQRGPGGPWQVTLRVSRLPNGARSGEATIADDRGDVVAQRTVTDGAARSCLPLARAIGAWATLVLDGEMSQNDREEEAPVAAAPPPPAPASAEPSDPDRVAMPAKGPPVDVGTSTFVKSGFGAGSSAGGSAFLSFEIASDWILRPAFAFGRATAPISFADGKSTLLSQLTLRADICRRIPGNYIDHRGLELDLCGGTDTTWMGSSDAAGTRMTVGPSATLRGELSASLAVEVRGMGGFAFEQSRLRNESQGSRFGGAAELGLSMRFP